MASLSLIINGVRVLPCVSKEPARKEVLVGVEGSSWEGEGVKREQGPESEFKRKARAEGTVAKCGGK